MYNFVHSYFPFFVHSYSIIYTNEVILEYQPKENEKIIRFVAISPKEKIPITVNNVKDKYGIISYKTNELLEN